MSDVEMLIPIQTTLRTTQMPKDFYTGKGKFGREYDQPAIIVGYYKEGKWQEDKLCTATMVSADIDKYDDRSLLLMIQELCKNEWETDPRRYKFIIEFSKKLQQRDNERKELIEKMKVNSIGEKEIVNDWEKQKQFYLGKSLRKR